MPAPQFELVLPKSLYVHEPAVRTAVEEAIEQNSDPSQPPVAKVVFRRGPKSIWLGELRFDTYYLADVYRGGTGKEHFSSFKGERKAVWIPGRCSLSYVLPHDPTLTPVMVGDRVTLIPDEEARPAE